MSGMTASLPASSPYSQMELRERINQGVPPASGQEYLARVRLEASALPSVLASTQSTPTPQPSIPTLTSGATEHLSRSQSKSKSNANASSLYAQFPSKLAPPPAHVLPSAKWKASMLGEFERLRAYSAAWIHRLPAMVEQGEIQIPLIPKRRNAVGWFKLCFGSDVAVPRAVMKQHRAKDELKDASKALVFAQHGQPPLLDLVLHIDHGTVEHLLKDHIYALAEENGPLQTHRGLWLFALLTRLEKPLTGEMAAALTKLTRVCRVRRDGVDEAELGSVQTKEEIKVLNVLLVVCEEGFRQTV